MLTATEVSAGGKSKSWLGAEKVNARKGKSFEKESRDRLPKILTTRKRLECHVHVRSALTVDYPVHVDGVYVLTVHRQEHLMLRCTANVGRGLP